MCGEKGEDIGHVKEEYIKTGKTGNWIEQLRKSRSNLARLKRINWLRKGKEKIQVYGNWVRNFI